MADRRVSITISAQDQFSTVLNKYNAALGKAHTTTQNVGRESQNMFQRFQQGLGSIQGLVTGFAALGAVKVGLDMRNLGEDVARTRRNFEALTADAGGAALALETMRNATRGAVDDFTLMNASNLMLSTGAATTAEELGQLSEIATTLGSVFGRDAATAMEEFNLMLANQSIPRLDTFGISASNVRARINELTSSVEGMDRSTAFRMAVIEEGTAAMARLGDVADQQMTAVDRLEAGFANAWNSISETAASGVESIASAMMDGIDILVNGVQERGLTAAMQEEVDQLAPIVQDAIDGLAGLDTEGARAIGESTGFAFVGAVAETIERNMAGITGSNSQFATALALYQSETFLPFPTGPGQDISYEDRARASLQAAGVEPTDANTEVLITAINDLTTSMREDESDRQRAIVERQYEAQERRRAEEARQTSIASLMQLIAQGVIRPQDAQYFTEPGVGTPIFHEGITGRQGAAATNADVRARMSFQELAPTIARQLQTGLIDGLSNIGSFFPGVIEAGRTARQNQAAARAGITVDSMRGMNAGAEERMRGVGGRQRAFFTPEEAEEFAQMLDTAQERVDALQAQFDEGLIGEEPLNEARELRDNMAEMADAAADGAASFSTLAGLLGTTDGGVLGELTDDLVSAAAAAGATAEQVAAMQGALDMASGRANALSVTMDNVVSKIGAAVAVGEVDPLQAAQAAQNMLDTLETGRLGGFDEDTLASRIDKIMGERGVAGVAAEGFDPTGYFGGRSLDFLTGGMAGKEGEGETQFDAMLEGMDEVQEAASATTDALAEMSEPVETLAGQVTVVASQMTLAGEGASKLTDFMADAKAAADEFAPAVENIPGALEPAIAIGEEFSASMHAVGGEVDYVQGKINTLVGQPYTLTVYVDLTGPGADILGGGGPRDNGGNVRGEDSRTSPVGSAPPPAPVVPGPGAP